MAKYAVVITFENGKKKKQVLSESEYSNAQSACKSQTPFKKNYISRMFLTDVID